VGRGFAERWVVFVAVSSAGLRRVLFQAARIGAPGATWVLATKG
jgi:hypothetical protein